MSVTSVRAFALAALLCLFPALAAGVLPEVRTGGAPASYPNFDARVNNTPALSAAAANRPAAMTALQARPAADIVDAVKSRGLGAKDFMSRIPAATVEFAPGTMAPENVYSNAGPLTADASALPSFEIAKNFLRSERALYGLSDAEIDALELIGESLSPSGLRMLRVRQVVNGRPVFLSETRILLDADGRILRTLGALVPDVTATAESGGPAISASSALVAAMNSVGVALDVAQIHEPMALGVAPGAGRITVDNSPISDAVTSELVYFPLLPGTVIAAWQQVTFLNNGAYTTVVDASTGTLLWRKNIQSNASTQDARFASTYRPTAPRLLRPRRTRPQRGGRRRHPVARHRAHHGIDVHRAKPHLQSERLDHRRRDADDRQQCQMRTSTLFTQRKCHGWRWPGQQSGHPIGNPDVTAQQPRFSWLIAAGLWLCSGAYGIESGCRRLPGAHALSPRCRDESLLSCQLVPRQALRLGFDEAAGNFQTTNFSGMGARQRPVLATRRTTRGPTTPTSRRRRTAPLAACRCTSSTAPPPTATAASTPTIVLHELTHGTSNRLIGNANGLIWDAGGGMGEGWSDFYALSLLNNTNADDPNGEYAAGRVCHLPVRRPATDNYLYGIRRFPYSTDNASTRSPGRTSTTSPTT